MNRVKQCVPYSLTDLWISLLSTRGWLRRLTRAASGFRTKERGLRETVEATDPGGRSSGSGGGLSKLKLAAGLRFMSKFLRASRNPGWRPNRSPYIHPRHFSLYSRSFRSRYTTSTFLYLHQSTFTTADIFSRPLVIQKPDNPVRPPVTHPGMYNSNYPDVHRTPSSQRTIFCLTVIPYTQDYIDQRH